MANKFHIKADGNPGACSAKPGNCPRGESAPHFETKEAAERHIEKMYEDLAKDPDYIRETALRREGRKENAGFLAARQKYRAPGLSITKYEIPLDAGVEEALESIRKVGNPLIVGGAVRDSFSDSDNKDIDIEVFDAKIDDIISNFRKDGFNVDEVGKKFGVLKISKKGVVNDLDVSVPRRENHVGAGHRGFEVSLDSLTVSEAAERRDFTFNAMSYDPKLKVLIDPAGGKKDLEDKVMCHVSKQFSEDPLRVLRGFQFAGRFDMSYAPETADLARSIRGEYKHLAVERVREEWGKFFTKSVNHSAGIRALRDSGWDDLTPGMSEALLKAENKLKGLDAVPKDRRRAVGTAIILNEMPEGKESNDPRELFLQETIDLKKDRAAARGILEVDTDKLINSSYERKLYIAETNGFSFSDYEHYGRAIGDKKILEVAEKAKADGVFDKPEPMLVTGEDIMKNTNRKPSRWFSELIKDVRRKQYSDSNLSREDLLEYMKNNIDKY